MATRATLTPASHRHRQFRAMRAACLALLALASAAHARPPAPAVPANVGDRDAARLLASEYREPARVRGAWSPAGDRGVRRAVCADSGAGRGERRIAVCTAVTDGDATADSVADLFVLAPPATRGAKPTVRARFMGIATGARGAAAPVRLLAVGPERTAFVVEAAETTARRAIATTTLYLDDGARLRDVLRLRSRLDTRPACAAYGAAAPRCRRHAMVLACTLEATPTNATLGLYPLALHVTGEDDGERVDRRVPIPHDAYGYRIAERTLRSQGCDADP